MASSPLPTRIFISYAGQDAAHLQALETHLANLKRQNRIAVWSDQVLEHGERWEPTLLTALREADILLCLVTPDFMASHFIHDVELKATSERERLGQVRIIPVFVRPTDLTGHPLDGHVSYLRHVQSITDWKHIRAGIQSEKPV